MNFRIQWFEKTAQKSRLLAIKDTSVDSHLIQDPVSNGVDIKFKWQQSGYVCWEGNFLRKEWLVVYLNAVLRHLNCKNEKTRDFLSYIQYSGRESKNGADD